MMARILIINLHSKLTYPDLSIAYLVTPLRAAGLHVEVKTLKTEAPSEQATNQRLKHNLSQPELNLTSIQKYLETTHPDLILIPSYLNHYATVQQLANQVADLELPLILGGGCLINFSSEDLPLWLNLRGVTAVFVGEADWVITDVVDTILRKQDLSVWPGICQSGLELETFSAPPLQELELLPLPDLSDFAWKTHNANLIPILTGRTAQLENKQYLYSSRPVQAVLEELQTQAERYHCKDFIFLDTSLNTNLAMWHGLIDNIQAVVPGCRWMATIYLDGKNPLGLDLNTFVAARAAGLRHLNISLDAAQALRKGKLLNAAMERNRELVAHAYQAGLSVRCLVKNHTTLNNLADLPNTNDLLLRKLVENEQAKQATGIEAQLVSPTKIETTALPKQNSAKKSCQVSVKTISSPPTATTTNNSFWRRFKKTVVPQKAQKTSEANQLV